MDDLKLRDEYLIEIKDKISKLNNLSLEIIKLKSKVNDLLIGINKCPSLIIEKIFSYLDFKDLLNCSKVCKKWMNIIQNFKIQNLEIIEGSYHEVDYFYESEFIKREYLFVSVRFELKTNDALLKNIKHLKIYKLEYFEDNYHILNDLPLEILEIGSIGADPKDCITTYKIIELNLENLKFLALDSVEFNIFDFRAPKLTAIRTTCETDLFYFSIKNPENIRHLYTESLASLGSLVYEKFKNLESIFCFGKYSHYYGITECLVACPNLKLIYLENKESTIDILNKKKELKLDNLDVVFNGILIENANQIDNADQIDNSIDFQNERFYTSLIDHPIRELNSFRNSKRIRLN